MPLILFRTRAFAVLALTASAAALALTQGTAAPGEDVYGALRWRHIGPEGNRVSAVAGIPGDPLVYYAGSASGGIFKTGDGGLNWAPVFDRHPVIRSATSRSRRLTQRSSGPEPAKRVSAATSRLAKASSNRPMPAAPGRGWASSAPAGSGASWSTRRIPMWCSPARWATRTARSPSAVCSARPTAARRGTRCSSSTTKPAAPSSRWIRRTRASSSRACGSSRSAPGAARVAVPAAAFFPRPTAARRGHGCGVAACRPATSARSRSRLRRRTRIVCTRSSRPVTACR